MKLEFFKVKVVINIRTVTIAATKDSNANGSPTTKSQHNQISMANAQKIH